MLRRFLPKRQYILHEKRELFMAEIPEPGGIENLGEIEFNTNPYNTDNVPRGHVDDEGKGMRERVEAEYGDRNEKMTGGQFKEMLKNGIKNVVNTIIGKQQFSDERLRAGVERARAMGKYRMDAPELESSGDIEKDIDQAGGAGTFDQFMNDATRHIWRMPDMQKGLVGITDALQRAWNFSMDKIQTQGGLAGNHELFRSSSWQKNMKVPGTYYNGRLSRIGSNVLGGGGRALSGELGRFNEKPENKGQEFINAVPARHRGVVEQEAKVYLDPSVNVNTFRWRIVDTGNDNEGKPHTYIVEKPGGRMDEAGEYLQGEEPFRGVVQVYGERNNGIGGEVLFVDFDTTIQMLATMQSSPTVMQLITEGGLFSDGQAELFNQFFQTLPDTINKDFANAQGIDFFKNPLLGRLNKHAGEIFHIEEVLDASGITTADLHWMRELDDAAFLNPGKSAKLKMLWSKIKAEAGGSNSVWERGLASIARGFKDRNGDDWFDHLKTLLDAL